MLHAPLWINLEDIVLREIHVLLCTVAQSRTVVTPVPFICVVRFLRTEGRMVGVRVGWCLVALVSRMEMNSGAGCTVLGAAAVHLARLRC